MLESLINTEDNIMTGFFNPLTTRLFSICILMFSINTVLADPGTLVDSPLFATSNNTPPNIFFEVDDSGSMDWEILTKRHWSSHTYSCNYSNFCGKIVVNGDYNGYVHTIAGGPTKTTTYKYFHYIFDNSDSTYSSVCAEDFGLTLETCGSSAENADWRVKSSSTNVIYYNPDQTYLPWKKGDGTVMDNAVFSATRSNPQINTDGYNLTKDLTDFVYHVWSDTHGFSGQRPKSRSINKTSGANGWVDWWDEHLRYTVGASSIIVDQITYTGRGTVETIDRVATLGSGTHPLLGGKTVAEVQQNIANWYQYSRRRSFIAKSAIASVISDNPYYRYGLNFINDTEFPYQTGNATLINVPPLKGSQAYNTEIINSLFSLDWPAQKTPLRQGLNRAGQYFKNGTPSPIVEECQKNFTILFTDGYWNGPQPSGIGDSDGDGQTGTSTDVTTVADVAHYYYSEDLSPLNEKQNMVTFSVAFGVKGSLADTNADGWPDPSLSASSSGWGNPFIGTLTKINDLWHAAFNSDGGFISAETPEEVTSALENALIEIGNRTGTAASASFSTTTLTADSAVFLAQFDGSNNQWTGDLKSYLLDNEGELATSATWSAATQLETKTANNRNIFTSNESKGVPFLWDELTESQQNDLRINPDGSSSTDNDDQKAKARLAFLRGERINEVDTDGTQTGTYSFRKREKLLGDIIHSTPVFVGEPELFWPNADPFPTGTGSYKNFKTGSAKTRTGIVYAGANDGMLHGFYTSDGEEAFAYIPKNIFSTETDEGLHYLTDTTYKHRYYIDMPLTISDVYMSVGDQAKKWRTVLIGGGRKGGRGLFALEVTDPSKFNQSTTNAENLVLWEFDQTDDEDLGFTFSKPSIARMNNGRWAAIFGNGYNSSGDGTASLFIVFLDGGSGGQWEQGADKDYIKITTEVGSNTLTNCDDCNGLSTPQPVDLNSDKVVDRIYAGDLKGNMWAFDVSSTNAENWEVAYKTSSPKPVFTAKHNNIPQPITLKPILVKHPEGLGGSPDVLIFFGTGQYLVQDDPADQALQSFYGVWDNGDHSLTPNDLVEQTFLFHSDEFRVLTDEEVDYSTKHGWVINLSLAPGGERAIVDPDLRGDLLSFNTWIPDASPCGSGGKGFLMFVNQINGGNPREPTFDSNNDGSVNSDDKVTVNSETYPPSGQAFNLGLPASSSFLNNKQYTPGTDSSGISNRGVANLSEPGTGRLSWQELRQ